MKSKCLSSLVMICFIFLTGSGILSAQPADKNRKTFSGTFGQFSAGYCKLYSDRMNDYLQQEKMLGSLYAPFRTEYTIGTEMSFYYERFRMGFGGMSIYSPVYYSTRGNVGYNIVSAFGKLGYAVYTGNNGLIDVYAGVGGLEYDLRLSNVNVESGISFDSEVPLLKGRQQSYSTGGIMIDVGMSMKRILIPVKPDPADRARGGVVLGIEIGVVIARLNENWKTGTTGISGPQLRERVMCPYLRLTFGPGMLRFK